MSHPLRAPCLALVACAALAGCAASTTTTMTPPQTATMGAAPSATAMAMSQPLSSADSSFATQAAANGMYEVEVSRLASTRAAMPQVRSYAQMMVDQHTASNNELAAILRARRLPMPGALPADKQARVSRMAALSGAAFDREYVRMAGVEDHLANIALFEQAERSVGDADLRAFMVKTMPVLRTHLQQAQVLAGQMAG